MFRCDQSHRWRRSFATRAFSRDRHESARWRRSPTSRVLLATSLAALLTGALAPSALASPPTRVPSGPIPDFTLTDTCSFPVLVHIDTNKEVTTTFFDGRMLVTGSLTVTLTNGSNPSRSIDLNISGPGTFTPLPNGGTLQTSVGPWLFFFSPNQLGPGSPGMLVLTTGVVTLMLDSTGTPTSFTHTNGTTTDLCAELA
jgi:hypothetical protein